VPEPIAVEPAAAPADKGLFARAVGVLLSPRATYASVAKHPRWLGALVLALVVMGGGASLFLMTDVGRRAAIDQQVSQREAFGQRPSQAQLDMMARIAPYLPVFALVSQVLFVSIAALVTSGILFGIFTVLLGGDATFKQLFAIVAHSSAVLIVQNLFTLPLDYVRETLTSPTNLAIFLPMLDENTFLVRMLGAVDLFLVWWMVNLAIGVGVLYRRRTAPIATGFLAMYFVLALIIAAVKTALSGA
jgi:hypothetical protein